MSVFANKEATITNLYKLIEALKEESVEVLSAHVGTDPIPHPDYDAGFTHHLNNGHYLFKLEFYDSNADELKGLIKKLKEEK